jgi:hypothetical protein
MQSGAMAQSPEDLDKALRAEADQLLGSGLREVLSDYGEVHVVGSYALHLMVWRDLDITIFRAQQDREQFFRLGGRIAELLKPHRMSYRDEFIDRTEKNPTGLYWGVYLGDARKGAWKIDIWTVSPDDPKAAHLGTQSLRERLSDNSRAIILRIKSQLWSHPEYRRTFSSQDIYDAVLDHDVSDIPGFQGYLRGKGVVISTENMSG